MIEVCEFHVAQATSWGGGGGGLDFDFVGVHFYQFPNSNLSQGLGAKFGGGG